MLILAYADWCGHCKRFKPAWNEFKAKYQPVLDIREVNADDDEEVAERLGVRGYPTIMMLTGGKKHIYQGDRSEESLTKFVKEHLNTHLKDDLRNYKPTK